MPAFFRISLLILCTRLWAAPAAAQMTSAPDSLDVDGVRVSLLTILPGDAIYSLWGHSAIRIYDPAMGVDHSYNYGTFDFRTSFFVARFLHGSLDYQLSVHDVDAALAHYRSEGRPVIEQVLQLSPEQTGRLVRFLEINRRPEHRSYRYHFLFDNCSTRVRDAFEAALGGAVRFADEPDPGATFRELIDPYQREVPFLDAGIDWLLGAPVDRVARPYETMFLPDYLMQAFAHAGIEIDGTVRPLVAETDTLLWIEGYEAPEGSFPWETVVTWLLFAFGLVVTFRSNGSWGWRGAARWLDAPLFLVVGLAGLLITYLWFVSHHDVTENNWHLIWTWPTHLVAGAALLKRRPPAWLSAYAAAGGALAFVAVAGIPLWPQAFNPVFVPLALLVALRGGALFWSYRSLPKSRVRASGGVIGAE